jgi:hypothetical protein
MMVPEVRAVGNLLTPALEAVGSSLERSLKAQIPLAHVADFPNFTDVWTEYFAAVPCAVTVVPTLLPTLALRSCRQLGRPERLLERARRGDPRPCRPQAQTALVRSTRDEPRALWLVVPPSGARRASARHAYGSSENRIRRTAIG